MAPRRTEAEIDEDELYRSSVIVDDLRRELNEAIREREAIRQERDEARAALVAAAEERDASITTINRVYDRRLDECMSIIERLRAALATARRDALEEVLSACHSNDGEVWRETILKLKDRAP